jgi:hypothetical protein
MRHLLRFIFFHMGFWPRLAYRWASLWLTTDYLKVEEIGIDRAWYIEGSWVLVRWQVENAWLVRVNHPGGFYHGSDVTWLSARPGMGPVTITVYGTRQTLRHTFPVHVRPLVKQAAADHHLQAVLDTAHINAGPHLRPRAGASLSPRLHLQRDLLPLWPDARQPSAGMQMQADVWGARSHADLDALKASYLGIPVPETQDIPSSPPELSSSND